MPIHPHRRQTPFFRGRTRGEGPLRRAKSAYAPAHTRVVTPRVSAETPPKGGLTHLASPADHPGENQHACVTLAVGCRGFLLGERLLKVAPLEFYEVPGDRDGLSSVSSTREQASNRFDPSSPWLSLAPGAKGREA